MGFKVPSNPKHCVILILDEELPLCPLSLSQLPVLSWFPVLWGRQEPLVQLSAILVLLSLGCL